MISCQRAAELISRSLEIPLSVPQRLALLIHLAACGMCRRFRRQSRLIQQAGELADDAEPAQQARRSTVNLPILSTAARSRIRSAIDQRLDGPRP